jgi:hypothetical protein
MLTEFQTYAHMVLCAGDADGIWHNLGNEEGSPTLPAPGSEDAADIAYLTSHQFDLLATLRCDDVIISKGLNVYYGLVLQCSAAFGPFAVGDLLVAVRGTMNTLEWANDGLAVVQEQIPGRIGQVGTGFWAIYASMSLNDAAGALLDKNGPSALAKLLQAKAKTSKVYVTGHSLGAALATYLANDLVALLAKSGLSVLPYMFASPRTGSQDYVNNYRATTPVYSVVNYDRDLVPHLPPLPLAATLAGGGPTHDVHVIPVKDPNAPEFSLLHPIAAIELAHNPACYAFMLDPDNPEAIRLRPK